MREEEEVREQKQSREQNNVFDEFSFPNCFVAHYKFRRLKIIITTLTTFDIQKQITYHNAIFIFFIRIPSLSQSSECNAKSRNYDAPREK